MQIEGLITLSIDFDGTVAAGKYPEIGEMLDQADVYINMLYAEGFHIIINTCRTGIHMNNAVEFMYKKGIKFHQINQNNPAYCHLYQEDCRKINADIYIDDKNLGGLPGHWSVIYQLIHNRADELREEFQNKQNQWIAQLNTNSLTNSTQNSSK